MGSKNLHNKPFDEGTLKKLEIFELYTKEWLPTFIMSNVECICIFDFFAGTGFDMNNVPGSPIRILRQIKGQIGNVFQKRTKIYLIFNEYDKTKCNQLELACDNYINENVELRRAKDNKFLNYKILQEDFKILFPQWIECINKYPSLVFLDQNGVKFTSDEYFMPLVNSHNTDFLYFISSSYVKRFGGTEEFAKAISYDSERAENEPATWIHRNILEELRKRIPQGNETKLYPFTIKKNANVYGIVFGASHPRAVDKFLDTAWKENNINGEANFDIDDDLNKKQLDLFGLQRPTKIQKFQRELRERIISKVLVTNKDVYDYTLEQGHIPSHAKEEMKRMKEEGLISYSRSPMINYEQVYKRQNIISYIVK
jgi:three-Cys-motif partner protein